MATTHHDINTEVDLTFNEKRVAFLRRKQQPQTALQRQKPFYYLLLFVAILCECLDGILTFSGIIHFASTKLNENAYFVFWLIGVAVVLLGFFKHKTMDVFHAQRLDDEYVPKSTYAFMLFFALISAAATYNVTTPALEYLTKTPVLASVDSVALRYDSLLAADMVVVAKEIETHGTTAKAIHKASSWNGKLDMNSQTKYENALSNKNQATAKKTDIVLARNAEKEAAIKIVIAKNDTTIQNHKDWCASFGSFLAWIFIAFEVLLYPAKWYCKDHEKKEVIEADTKVKALLAQGQSVSPSTNSQNTQTSTNPLPTTNNSKATKLKGRRSSTFAQKVTQKTPMQFPQGEPATCEVEPLEGVVIPPQGNGVHRVTIKVKGVVVEKTKGQLNTLKRAPGMSEKRRNEIQELINKLP